MRCSFALVVACGTVGCDSDEAFEVCALPQASCSLRDVADVGGILVDAAVEPRHIEAEPVYAQTFAHEFNSMTPENRFKWPLIHPQRNEFDFAPADALVDFATQHGMSIRGHTLIWAQPGNIADYVRSAQTAEELRAMMAEHFEAVVGRYADHVDRWDVINEPLETLGTDMVDNVFTRLLGPGYIAEALELAHALDPTATLWINEVAIETSPAKANALHKVAADLVDRGVPLHGIGLQTHLIFGRAPNAARFEAIVRSFADLGLEVAITEMDLTAPEGPDRFEIQAEGYATTVRACLAVTSCREVTFWGFTDRHTWLDTFLRPGLAPLLFDVDYVPKPAYFAVREVLREHIGAR
jgi:endo-1,4-beta-xylanase